MGPLNKAQIGTTSLWVTRLGLGGAPLGGLFEDVSDDAAISTVRRGFELGINFFDTAPLYGHGKSEVRVGKVLAEAPKNSWVLATKVGRVLVPVDHHHLQQDEYKNPALFNPVFDFSYDGVMRSFDASLKRLGVDHIDILHIHDPDDHYEQAIDGAYHALDQLRRDGRIKAVGVGINQAELLMQFARDGNFDCFLLAGRYTLIDHTGLKELLPLCVKKHISIIIGGPYNSGVLATGAQPGAKFNYADAKPEILEKVRKVQQVCDRHKVPMKAAALQFPLAHPAVAAVIPGARSVAELEENFQLIRHSIPADFWAELRSEKLIPENAPTPASQRA